MGFVRRHQVAIFVVTVLLVGGVGGDLVATHPYSRVCNALRWPVGFSPCIAAVLLTWCTGGSSELRQLLRGLITWRVRPIWYLVALGLFPLLLGGVSTLHRYLLSDTSPPPVRFPDTSEVWDWVRMFFLVTIAEEVGWRGYLQARLQRRWSALPAALLVGLVWGLWHGTHLADHWRAGYVPIAVFVLATMGMAVALAWILANARGSLLLVGLAHTSRNAFLFVMPILRSDDARIVALSFDVGALFLLGIVLVFFWGPDLRRRETSPRRPTG